MLGKPTSTRWALGADLPVQPERAHLLASFGKEGKPEPAIAKITEMIGTTHSKSVSSLIGRWTRSRCRHWVSFSTLDRNFCGRSRRVMDLSVPGAHLESRTNARTRLNLES